MIIALFIGLICLLWVIQKALNLDDLWAWKALATIVGVGFALFVVVVIFVVASGH